MLQAVTLADRLTCRRFVCVASRHTCRSVTSSNLYVRLCASLARSIAAEIRRFELRSRKMTTKVKECKGTKIDKRLIDDKTKIKNASHVLI